jgi:Flp pilus assembly protein TadD
VAKTFSRAIALLVLGAWLVSAQTVSVDLLRHPVNGKALKMLRSALVKMRSGDHTGAIAQLTGTLSKYPDSAVYVHSLLGVEYLRADRMGDAVSSFEQASRLLPHDAIAHYNLGLTLLCAGNSGRAREEVRLALKLDPGNPRIQEAYRVMAGTEHLTGDLRPPSGNKP